MLVKDTKNDIYKEISVSINFTFDAVKPYMNNEGTDFIKAVLGTTLYNELDEAYEDAGTLEQLDEKWQVLLPLCQRPLIYYSFLMYLPFGDVLVTDGGISVAKSDNSAPASAQRVENLKSALEEIAYSGREKLLKFLYANADIYSWDPTKYIKTIVSFSSQLNEHTNTTIPVKSFNKLLSSVKFVEENELKTLIFPDLFNKILEQVQDNMFDDEEAYDFTEEESGSGSGDDDNLVNHKILLDLIRPGIANLALAHGLASQRIDISASGITEVFASDRNRDSVYASASARSEVLQQIVNRFTEVGNMYFKKAKDYLIEHPEDFPLYEDAAEYDADETVDDSVYENDADDLHFDFV